MGATSPHAFRYEPELCSMGEGETIAQWRRRQAGDAAVLHGGRPGRGLRRLWPATRSRASR